MNLRSNAWSLLAFLFGSMLVMMTGANAASPILLNGGFEEGKAAWWGGGEIVHSPVAEGQAALKLSGGYVAQDKRPVEAGKRYRISMQIRTDASPETSVYVQMSFRGDGVNPGWRGPAAMRFDYGVEPALFVTGGTHDWKIFSLVIQAPPNANQLLLYLRKKDGTAGTAYYDAVEIEPTDEPVLNATEIKRKQRLQALLAPPLESPSAPATGNDGVHPGAAAPSSAMLAALEKIAAQAKASPVPASLTLVDHGVARYRIHVGSDTDLITLSAAAELAQAMQKISGADMPAFAHDAAPQTGPLLIIGRDSALTARLCPDIDYDSLGTDGFVLCTVGPDLVISGATPRGTMYGVHWFLDRKLGVKWLSPTYTLWPSNPTIAVAPLNERQVPRFSYREILSYEGQDKFFRAHNLLNGESMGASFLPSPPEIDSWNHSWMAQRGNASFFELLPQNTFGKAHPDWYAGGQLAMMNPAMREAMAVAVIGRLKQVPDYKTVWFDIHDMDWGWDMDAASKAFADQHGGSASAPRLDMMIDVAARVRKVLPDAKFAFNAYHWSFTPPKGMVVPDYILVFPMTIHVDYSHPLNQSTNEQLGRDIAGWNAIAKHVQIWDHVTNFSGYIQPTPNIYPIGASIQWLATLPNVQGYFAEGSWDTPAGEFASLRVWMMARLLWNPQQDVHALVAEYCRDYFGAAGASVLQYIDLMHAAIAKSGDMLSEKTQVDVAMLDLDFIRAANRLFDEAEKSVASDPVMLAHVQEARLPIDYVSLVRRQDYRDEAARRHIAWDDDTAQRLIRFKQTVKQSKLMQYRQGGWLPELNELLAVERHAAAAPDFSAIFPSKPTMLRSSWVDFQDLSFNRYDSARIVADAAASDGAAARMNGNSSTWAVQFKLDKLPKAGLWDLYAAIRVDAAGAAAAHDNDAGAHVGSYPPMSRFDIVKVSALNDGQYHLVKIPGGPFRHEVDHGKGVFLQAPANGAVKYLYVDRIVAVSAGAVRQVMSSDKR